MAYRFASSAARDLATELELDEADLAATGENGAITIADVRSLAPDPPPPPPEGLGESGTQLWVEVQHEWELRADQERLLAAACRTADEIDSMEAVLAGAEMVVAGSKGQDRGHPLLAEVRAHRLALKQLLGGLGIRDVLEGDQGDDDAARSHAGRALARQRWSPSDG